MWGWFILPPLITYFSRNKALSKKKEKKKKKEKVQRTGGLSHFRDGIRTMTATLAH